MTGSRPTAPDELPDERQNFWAGPALVLDGADGGDDGAADGTAADGTAAEGTAMAILVLWEQVAAEQEAPDPPDLRSTLLDRGFVRLADPTLDQLQGLPSLDDARVRLSTDGHDLHIDDRGETLFEGDLQPAPDRWWATAQQGRFALLIDTAPVPDQATPAIDHERYRDLSAWATQRMIDACRAEAMVGARLEVVTDGP